MRKEDFAPEFWKQIEPVKDAIAADLKSFGPIKTATFISDAARGESGRAYLYKLEFKNASVLQETAFDASDRVASLKSLGVEWKHPLPL
jgi:hypothetical protein